MSLGIRNLNEEVKWSLRFRRGQKLFHAHHVNGVTIWFRDSPLASAACYPGEVVALAEVAE